MQKSKTQAVMERVVTGSKCEVHGCYEMAVWLVSFREATHHWCPKHMREKMRNSARWRTLSDLETGSVES
jgi:hypothetical protein